VEFAKFLLSRLPPPPARVLEVGCGSGDLARAVAEIGYAVVAIDPEAPEGAMFRRVSLEDFSDPEPFHAVVAGRSLHHIEDLERAVDTIHDLLRGTGSVILDEFAWDRMDVATAAWYLGHVKKPGPKDASLLPGSFPDAWIKEHDDLHETQAMISALSRRFHEEFFEWVPYIARNYLEREDLEDEEKELIDSGAIQAIGFRYVGRRD
jgi:SAM-dependent methyltransferase